jgi:hypothetical protein
MEQVYDISTLSNHSAILSAMIVVGLIALYLFGCMKEARYYTFMRNGTFIRARSESSEV